MEEREGWDPEKDNPMDRLAGILEKGIERLITPAPVNPMYGSYVFPPPRAYDDSKAISDIALRLLTLDPNYRTVSHAHLAVVAAHIWRECCTQGEALKGELADLAADRKPQWQLLRVAANEGWCAAERFFTGKEYPDSPERVKWLNEQSGYYVPEMGQVEPVPTHGDA